MDKLVHQALGSSDAALGNASFPYGKGGYLSGSQAQEGGSSSQ